MLNDACYGSCGGTFGNWDASCPMWPAQNVAKRSSAVAAIAFLMARRSNTFHALAANGKAVSWLDRAGPTSR